MSKTKDFYTFSSIGKLDDINSKPADFYNKTIMFLKNNNDNFSDLQVTKELDRLLDILKISDVFMDDDGEIVNYDYMKIIQYFQGLNLNTILKDKIDRFLREVTILLTVKKHISRVKRRNDADIKLIQRCNNSLQLSLIRMGKSVKNGDYYGNNFEDYIFLVSQGLRNLSSNMCLNDVNQLNGIDKNFHPDLSFLNFRELVRAWKYADAKITQNNGDVVINALTDIAESFVITRNLNSANRKIDYSVAKTPRKAQQAVSGIGEEYFFGVRRSERKKDILSNMTLLNIPLKDWLVCLFQIYDNAVAIINHVFNYFIPAETILNFGNSELSRHAKTIIKHLRFKYDLLDTPVIYIQSKPYFYLPSLIMMDPVHVISGIMKSNGDWQQFRGTNFEDEIARILKENNITYAKNGIEFKENGRKHEIDLITHDTSANVVFIECKTFSDPFSYRDYRYELDKMISHRYLVNDSGHFKALREVSRRIVKNKGFGNKSDNNELLQRFLRMDLNWSDMYPIFVTNLIFPKCFISKWNGEFPLLFVHYFEFYRLVNGILLNEMTGASVNGGTNKKVFQTDLDIYGVSKKSFQSINNEQPLRELEKKVQNMGKQYVADAYQKRCDKFNFNGLNIRFSHFE